MTDARKLPEPKLPERTKSATPKPEKVSETPKDTAPKPVVCAVCGRERTPADFDYNPIQVFWGNPLGWYSGDDGEFCPDDIGKLTSRANDRG